MLFKVEPFAYELIEPDYFSGEIDTIRKRNLRMCQGGYSTTEVLPVELKVSLNVKRCETSLMDWVRGESPYGPGFHILCYYEDGNEMELAKPYKSPGFYQYRHTYWESCFRQRVFEDIGESIVYPDRPPYVNPKYQK